MGIDKPMAIGNSENGEVDCKTSCRLVSHVEGIVGYLCNFREWPRTISASTSRNSSYDALRQERSRVQK